MTAYISSIKMSIPSQWPPEVSEIYEPVRELGRGGFASVILARRKDAGKDCVDKLVAMKVVGEKDPTRQEVGYAHREIDILKELNHPNIMRLVQYWEPPACAAVMALSYVKGSTLESLLGIGGRLSLNFARVVTAQLVDAITYLHSRAVIHRDIKPDNLLVKGTSRDQDEIWDDSANEKNPNWPALVAKWHVTLVDFGFARALTPADMKKKLPPSEAGGATMDSSTRSMGSSGGRSRRSVLNRSMSRRFTRKMSAVGNRMYAAPEITRGIEKNLDLSKHPHSNHFSVDVTKTLSDHTSYYGMLVDSFSIGNTMKYMLTGVPPNKDISETIDAQNHPVAKFGRFLGKRMGKNKSATEKKVRRVKYRPISQIPPEVVRLIKGCTHYDPPQRTSVRMARMYPWIDDALEGVELPDSREVQYLDLTRAHKTTGLKEGPSPELDTQDSKTHDEVEREGITF